MNFTNPHFAEPHWLWLAVLGPVGVIFLYRYAAWRRQRQIVLFAAPEVLEELLRTHSPTRRRIKHALLVLAVAAMGIALARPQWGETAETSHALGEDILFVIDCSKSMLATDVQPNRLSRAKFAILDFVQRHGRGRVGLVAFAGQAFLQCPLTFDYDAFRDALISVDEHTIPVGGTDIGRALDEANLAMEKNSRRKILVLLTDGEDLEKTGIKKAEALAEQHIIVFTVGVGTAAGSLIRIVNDQGVQETLLDPDGKPVQSHLDDSTLSAIAQATHGSYHPLGAVGEGLVSVRREVESSTEAANYASFKKTGVDRFHLPIAAVVVLLVLESLIGTRRNLGHSVG